MSRIRLSAPNWRRLATACRGDVEYSDAFLLARVGNSVVDFWGVRERASYLAIERRGREQRLDRSAREKLWPVFAAMRARLDVDGRMTPADLCEAAAEVLATRQETPFEYLLLDEFAGFFGPRELAFAIQLASKGGSGPFFAGDPGQRVFKGFYRSPGPPSVSMFGVARQVSGSYTERAPRYVSLPRGYYLRRWKTKVCGAPGAVFSGAARGGARRSGC